MSVELSFLGIPRNLTTAVLALAIGIGVALALGAAMRTLFGRALSPLIRWTINALLVFVAIETFLYFGGPALPAGLYNYISFLAWTLFFAAVFRFLLRMIMGFLAKRGSAAAVNPLIRHILFVLLLALVVSVLLREILDVHVTSIVATSAVLTAVIGLALQSTLANVIAGLTIQTDRLFKPGDWVALGEHKGVVLETSIRSTKIRTREHVIVVVPNGKIIEAPVVNYSQPGPEYIRPFFVSVGYEHSPGEVKEAIREALAGQPHILQDPPAAIRVDSYGDFAVSYEIRAWVKDGVFEELVRDEALTRMWYIFKRHGIRIPFPIRDVMLHAPPDPDRIAGETARGVEALLRDVQIMSPLSEEERSRVARAAHVHRYARGEVLFRQGDAGESFFLIRSGSVDIVIQDASGTERNLATLGPGEYFGEMSLLTGEPRSATARVTRDLVVVVVTKDHFASLLEANPELADRFSETLARRQAEIHAELARETGEAQAFSSEEYRRGLRGRIRQFFRLKPRKER